MLKVLDNNYYDMISNNILVPPSDTEDNVTYLNEFYSLIHMPAGNFDPCGMGQSPYSTFPTPYIPASLLELEVSELPAVWQTPGLDLL